MSCQTVYSPPITIPSAIGIQGPAGPAGANGSNGTNGTNGTNGVAILANTIASPVTSSGGAGETLASYDIGAGVLLAGDILEIEVLLSKTTTFYGDFSVTLGGVDIYSRTVYETETSVLPPLESQSSMYIKIRVIVSSTTAQKYYSESIDVGTNGDRIVTPLKTLSLDTESDSDMEIDVKTSPTAGTITCNALIVSHNKKIV